MNKHLLVLALVLLSTGAVAQELSTEVLYKIVSPAGLVVDNKESKEDDIFLSRDVKSNKGQLWKLIRPGSRRSRSTINRSTATGSLTG